MKYILHLATIGSIFLYIAAVLRFVTARAGIVLASAGVPFAVGAYAVSLLQITVKVGSTISFLCVPIIGALAGLPLLLFIGRASTATFFAVTLFLQVAFYSIIYNWGDIGSELGTISNLTNGAQGISFPDAAIFGLSDFSYTSVIFILISLLGWAYFLSLEKSGVAVALDAVRRDRIFSIYLGISPFRLLVACLLLAHAALSFAGAMFAIHIRYVDPTLANVPWSLWLLSLGLLASVDPLLGPPVATFVIVIVPELLRYVLHSDSATNALRLAISSIVIIMFLLSRRRAP